MSELDFFGHWGYFFLLVGLFYVGCKDKVGWIFRFFGETIWIYLGFMLGMSSIWVWGFIFLALDVKNYLTWIEEEKAAFETAAAEQIVRDLEVVQNKGATYMERKMKRVMDEAEQRQSKRKNLAAGSSRSRKKKVQPATGRRSKPANGKRRSRSNDVTRRPKGRKNLVRV